MPRRQKRVVWHDESRRGTHDDDSAAQLAPVLLEVFGFFRSDADDRAAHGAFRAGGPAGSFERQHMHGGRNDAAAGRATRPTIGNGPGLEVHVRKTGLLETLHRPPTGPIQLRRTSQPRPNAVGQKFQAGFQFILAGLHLFENFCIHLGDRILLGRFRFCGLRRGKVGQRTAREHGRQLRGVVGPGCKHLRTLIQIVLPDFIEGVGLAVMSFWILSAVIHTAESGDAHVIERSVVGPERARHLWLEQIQLAQRPENLVDSLPVLIIVMEAESQHAAGAGVVDQHSGDFFQFVSVSFDIFL